MKKVILYEPSIGSDNIGDQIIVDGVKTALNKYLEDAFVIELPTHTPLSNRYLHYLGSANLKLVCGSNIIAGRVNSILHLNQWMIGSAFLSAGPVVLMGVGAQKYGQKVSIPTRLIYRMLFEKGIIHSVRDSYTEDMLKKNGFKNVINTGCPTLWGITQEVQEKIPKLKARRCVFTLTDYQKDSERDLYMINAIKKHYDEVFFWPQGNGDYDYYLELNKGEHGISLVAPNLSSYDQLLESGDIDYIGTRLHGGIRALQKKIRTIIIGIDNRAIELNKDFGLPVLSKDNILMLEEKIETENIICINLPYANIEMFMKQFV